MWLQDQPGTATEHGSPVFPACAEMNPICSCPTGCCCVFPEGPLGAWRYQALAKASNLVLALRARQLCEPLQDPTDWKALLSADTRHQDR